jgi:hypothetical protein
VDAVEDVIYREFNHWWFSMCLRRRVRATRNGTGDANQATIRTASLIAATSTRSRGRR